METSPKDDLYLYANYGWLLNTDIPAGDKNAGVDLAADGREHVAKTLSGNDLTGHDARQAQLFYRAAVDTAARDAVGVEPAKATVDAIRGLVGPFPLKALAELMGGPVGYSVFHEIGHALDPKDIYVDKNGNMMEESLLESASLEEYEKRVQKAKDYYDNIVVFTGQNVIGDVCLNEGLTEICGLQARLAYAAKQEGFDYKAFFENRAKMARGLRTPELELQCIVGADTHPSAFLDVNGEMQQFDKFYETYDVKEGDGMYLAPEARIVLW